jgi:hypothetical protein
MAIDFLDAFAGIVNAAVAPREWPPILMLDAKPVFKADHSLCCQPCRDEGEKPPFHEATEPTEGENGEIVLNDVMLDPAPTGDEELFGPLPPTVKRRPKVDHDAPMVEVGRILVAVGYATPDSRPSPWLIRFAGGGDEASWTEFLETLPVQPEWVVSDRDGVIAGAVRTVFGDATHYLCEQHLAQNCADVAREKDDIRTKSALLKIPETQHEVRPALEAAQYDEAHWNAAIEAAHKWGLRLFRARSILSGSIVKGSRGFEAASSSGRR